MLNAALSGCGLAYLPEDLVALHLVDGSQKPVLEAWWPTFAGLHMYYPSRRQSSRALTIVVDTLRRSWATGVDA